MCVYIYVYMCVLLVCVCVYLCVVFVSEHVCVFLFVSVQASEVCFEIDYYETERSLSLISTGNNWNTPIRARQCTTTSHNIILYHTKHSAEIRKGYSLPK